MRQALQEKVGLRVYVIRKVSFVLGNFFAGILLAVRLVFHSLFLSNAT